MGIRMRWRCWRSGTRCAPMPRFAAITPISRNGSPVSTLTTATLTATPRATSSCGRCGARASSHRCGMRCRSRSAGTGGPTASAAMGGPAGGPLRQCAGDLRVEQLHRLHVNLLDTQDRVLPAEEHDPAVLSLHVGDVLVRLPDNLLVVSVDHAVRSHRRYS